MRVRLTSHPVVFPNAHHCIGAEGTSRVHAVSYYDERTVQNHPKVDKISFNLEPVRGIAKRWQVVMDSPMARGAEP